MLLGVNLSGFDRCIQTVFLGREGAGRVFCKGTGWTVGFVEVNEYPAVLMGIGVMITPGGIGLAVIGQVHELDEKTVVRQLFDDQLMFLSIQFKREKALHGFVKDRAEN